MFDSMPLEDLQAAELSALADELQAYVRHPAIIAKPNTQKQADARLALVLAELERRWTAVWYHEDNRGDPRELITWENKPVEKLSLRAVRQASGRSFQDMADILGYNSRQQVNNTEARKDWLVSTVAQYIAAAGGTATLTVEVNGETLEFEL